MGLSDHTSTSLFAPIGVALRMFSRLYPLLLIACIVLMIWGWVMDKRVMPKPADILPVLQQEPIQKLTTKPQFTQTENGHLYYIRPLYTYELYGLVVSKHEANSSFSNRAHEKWGDYLNTTDLCVLWGENVFSGIYQDIEFSSGQWTCFIEPKSGKNVSWNDFDLTGIGNNHMLISSADMARKLKDVRIGDQIRFKGYLAEYGANGRLIRGTSITRTDTGQGACETVYVEQLEILKPVTRYWRDVSGYAMWGALIAFLLWMAALFPVASQGSGKRGGEEPKDQFRSKRMPKQALHPARGNTPRQSKSTSRQQTDAGTDMQQAAPVSSDKYFVMRQGVDENTQDENV